MARISIVVPVFNEAGNLHPLYEEVRSTIEKHLSNYEWELILVDDGSTDGSAQEMDEIAARDRSVKIVRFRKNFGQSAAFDAGFRCASGEFIFTMDGDGQNDPSDFPKLLALLERDEADFVTGNRQSRNDNWFHRKIPSYLANWLIRLVTRTKIHDLGCSLKVGRAEIVKEITLCGEMHRYYSVIMEMTGARVVELPVNHRPRLRGQSKYGWGRVWRVLLDLCTVWFIRGYYSKPLHFFGAVGGLLLGVVAPLVWAVVWYEKIYLDAWVHRNPLFIIGTICALVGFQFIGLGILAEMLVRTQIDSRQKSFYSIASRKNL